MGKKWHSVVIENHGYGMEFWAQDNDGGNLFRITENLNGPVDIKLPDGTTKKARLDIQDGGPTLDDILIIHVDFHGQRAEINAEEFEEGFCIHVEEPVEYFVLFRREVYLTPTIVRKGGKIQTRERAAASLISGDIEGEEFPGIYTKGFADYTIPGGANASYLVSGGPVVLPDDLSSLRKEYFNDFPREILEQSDVEEAWDAMSSDNSNTISIEKDTVEGRR